VFNNDLDKDIAHEEGGHLGRIFRSIASGNRSDSRNVDNDLAKKEAQELYDVTHNNIRLLLKRFYGKKKNIY
jgi:hypothetical protein